MYRLRGALCIPFPTVSDGDPRGPLKPSPVFLFLYLCQINGAFPSFAAKGPSSVHLEIHSQSPD
jgi:hypothetical protein